MQVWRDIQMVDDVRVRNPQCDYNRLVLGTERDVLL
jgi:hypothetical protein